VNNEKLKRAIVLIREMDMWRQLAKKVPIGSVKRWGGSANNL